MRDIAGEPVPERYEDHGKNHMWIWTQQTEEDSSFTRIVYNDNIHEANIVCAVPGCGLVMPGSEYIGVVEKMRQYLHLGEDEHIQRMQDMLEILALTHEHEPRMKVDPSMYGDRE